MNIDTTERSGIDFRREIKDGPALLELARGWLKQGNTVVALELLQSALESPEAERLTDVRAKVLKETGRALMMQSEWDKADTNYVEAQRLFLSDEDYRGASECARNRANMLFQQGKFTESRDLCETALEWASTIKDYELRATILNTLAAINSTTGEHREALKAFKLCLADFRSASNILRQGYVLLNIGLTHIDLTEFPEAVGSLNEALAIAMTEKDLHLVEICYQNISKCYLEQNETMLAKSVIDTARKILPGLNSSALETELNVIDCKILRLMGNFNSALALMNLTYDQAVENKMAALQADVLFEQGQLYKQIGSRDLAIAKFNAAAQQYRQIDMDKRFRDSIQAVEHLEKGADRKL